MLIMGNIPYETLAILMLFAILYSRELGCVGVFLLESFAKQSLEMAQ